MDALIIFILFITFSYTAGTIAERRHYRSIESRERAFMNMPAVTTVKTVPGYADVERAELVAGSAVISLDYFKRISAGLRNIVGGEVMSYETLIDRARREAVLRMKEKASGAGIIVNLRIETSAIGQTAERHNSIGSIEAVAYGTALTLRKGK